MIIRLPQLLHLYLVIPTGKQFYTFYVSITLLTASPAESAIRFATDLLLIRCQIRMRKIFDPTDRP